MKNNLMAALGKVFTNTGRNAILHIDIAACKSSLAEPGGLQSFLNIHSEIDDVGDELRVRLRLVVSAHDPEADVNVVLFDERGDDGVQRPLARLKRVGMLRIQLE